MGHERVRLTYGEARGPALADRTKQLDDYVDMNNQPVVLYFKDLGMQIGWTTVFLFEYFGPILMTVILALFQKQIYGKQRDFTYNQKLGMAMVLLHYTKRELETIFVHRFSSETMPFTNIFKNSFHYWFSFGFCTMYFFLHPDYTPPAWASDEVFTASFVLFCIFEFLNFQCHLVQKNLRRPGTTERGIPHGWGFGLVSTANYFWESMCWLTFCVQAQTLGGYWFLLTSVAQMTDWALKKHRRYKKEFKNYPKGRKAIFPFIL